MRLPTSSGYEVPLFDFPTTGAPASVLIVPALGIRASYYEGLARRLQEAGLSAAIIEGRGHGESALRPGRRSDWGFEHWITEDLPAVIAHLKEQSAGAPVYLCGHSIGGHYSVALAALDPKSVDGIALIACGSPYHAAYEETFAKRIRMLARLVPAVNLLFGYFPGDRIGFGGKEARTIMREWRMLARENRYCPRGMDHDFDAGVAAYPGPVLALRMGDDDWAPEPSVRAVIDKFQSTQVRLEVISSEELGVTADHHGWCKRPDAVARLVAGWIDSAS